MAWVKKQWARLRAWEKSAPAKEPDFTRVDGRDHPQPPTAI